MCYIEIMHIIFAIFVQVIDTRNRMFHSSSFKEEHNAMKNKIQQMIELLEAKDLADDTDAQDAAKCLKEVRTFKHKCLRYSIL